MGEKPNIVITISRQMGGGGSYVGHSAAKELGFKYVDRELLQRAAKHLGTSKGGLKDLDERSMGLVKSIIREFSFGLPDATYAPPMIRPIYDKDLFMLECRIMDQIVDEHSALSSAEADFMH